jgi:hypothetical protein
MGEQPLPDLVLHGRPWGCSSQMGERGNGKGSGGGHGCGAWLGPPWGGGVLGAAGGARLARVVLCT